MTVPCVDLPEKVAVAAEQFYEERGGFDRWWQIGLDNLQQLLWDEPLEHFPVGLDSELPQFQVVRGESVMVASFALFLTELLAGLGEPDLGRGVLVAVPERRQVLYRVVRGAEALPAVGEMAIVARSVHRSTAGALSPHVFLVDGEGWHQLHLERGRHRRGPGRSRDGRLRDRRLSLCQPGHAAKVRTRSGAVTRGWSSSPSA